MKRFAVCTFLLISFTVCSGNVFAQNTLNSTVAQESDKFQAIIPKTLWERIFFESINERANSHKLSNLRLKGLPADNLEMRLWTGFGLTRLEGFVLKRTNGEWSASALGWEYIKDGKGRQRPKQIDKKLDSPKSGWEAAWKKLVDTGILSLPDAEAINCGGNTYDGTSYVVEYNLKNVYRTYMFDNPQNADCAEAQKMVKISKIVAEEYYRR